MATRFIFLGEVEELIAKGQSEMEFPEGTRLSPAAADLIKEKGIRLTITSLHKPDSGKVPEPEAWKNISARSAKEKKSVIAVVSDGQAITGSVGDAAARSRYFLFFDGLGELIEVLENPHRDTGGGAGPLVASLMAERGVSTMVAGAFGTNIKAGLKEKNVDYLEFSGQVGEAVKLVSGGR